MLHYSMEWAFFTRTQRGEFDTALYELERCWGREPGQPHPARRQRPAGRRRTIRTLDDVHAAMAHYVEQLAAAAVISMATHISTDIVFRPVYATPRWPPPWRGGEAGRAGERDIYASYIHEAFLTALEPHAERIAFQFSFAAEPMPHETASLVPQRAIAHLADMAARHPEGSFRLLLGQPARRPVVLHALPRAAQPRPGGYWWHNFFPERSAR